MGEIVKRKWEKEKELSLTYKWISDGHNSIGVLRVKFLGPPKMLIMKRKKANCILEID